MAVQWLLVCHGLTTLPVLVSFLCGHWTIFDGTFIRRINNFLAYEFYYYILRFANAVGGSRCINSILGIENFCCNRPNPLLQLLYLGIIGGTYFLIAKTSFSYIPGYYLSEVHRSTSMLAVGVGILLFLLTSFSDPGTVNEENVSDYLSAYPYDNVIYSKKECQTCKILKPARSKHCSICDRCVARFDHHCGWMNNCIGEKNTRYFLAFLLWHLLLCIYGTVTLGLILAGQIKKFRVVYILTVYYGIENSFFSLAPDVVQWLLGSHNNQVLIIVFLAIVSLLLGGFLGYHVKLCLTNTTTNETVKWQDYINWQRKANEAKASAQALKESIKAMSTETKPPKRKWRTLCRRPPLEDTPLVAPKNMYDKGFLHNFLEIFFPMSTRWSFSKTKMKSS